MLDGKPIVTDDDTLGAVARSPTEARALANARAAMQNADHALAVGNVALAQRLYRSALEHYPGYVSAYRGLGRAFARDGNVALAQQMLEQYLHVVPDAPDAAKVRRWIAQLARDPGRPLEP
jgi:tetratricopeptide (TPR) repeat protein